MSLELDRPSECEVYDKAIEGAKINLEIATSLIKHISSNKKQEVFSLGFPDTAFYLPLINALFNKDIKNIEQLPEVIDIARSFIKAKEDLESALDSGISSLITSEIIEAMRYQDFSDTNPGWQGFIPDSVYRALGFALVDGRIPAIAVILGSASDPESSVSLIRELQTKNILSLLVGESKGITFKSQLEEKRVSLGLDSYIVPLGPSATSLIYAVNLISRIAISFGGVEKGNLHNLLHYIKGRVMAFVLCLGELDPLKVSLLCGIMKLGLPVLTDHEISYSKECQDVLDNLLLVEKDYSKIISRAIIQRGIKIKIDKIDIPVNYSAAFEGERIRKEQMHLEFGAGKVVSFELLRQKDIEKIKDGIIEVIGPELHQLQEAKTHPLAIVVDIAGKKMQLDFEPVLERQIHRFLNYAQGVFHLGQRDMNWIRISKEAFGAGLRLKDLGKILYAKFHNEYPAIVDKVAIFLYTDVEEINRLLPQARQTYRQRDERLSLLNDENVDRFYSCLLCTSFAPNHVCVISPERTGLCGAVSWLDAKAAYEVMPTGGNKPIERGICLDNEKGEWEGINKFVYQNSNKTIERLCIYSLLDSPMSACGCFEAIVAILPEANGVIIVNREYDGMTPIGMKFTTLAGTVGGGKQTPGFMGIAKRYIASKRFISAEGGIRRIVWMPKGLKEAIREDFLKRAQEIGMPELLDKIADETICTEVNPLLEFLEKVRHPVLTLDPLL